MRRILVTGANGQLGNEVRLQAALYPEDTYFFTDVAELDICNRDAVMQYVKRNAIDLIINCAAFTAVDKAEEEIALCEKLNTEAVEYLAEAAEANGASLIQISTDYVFNGKSFLPYKETDEPCPNSVYGRSKLAGEKKALQSCSQTLIIRTAWLYSTFGNNFVKTMIRLGKERESLGVIFDQIGTPTYARDLAKAIFAAFHQGIVPGIYHFSNEGVCSWYDFTKAIHRMSGITTCKVAPLHTDEYPTKAARPAYSVLDKTKIKQTYGLEIPHWEDSLKDCLEQLNK